MTSRSTKPAFFHKYSGLSLLVAGILAVVSLSPGKAAAQESTIRPGNLSDVEIARMIKTFTAKETEFRRALNNYSFKRDATLQSIGMGGQVDGEFHRVSYFTFDDRANRYEKIVFAPCRASPMLRRRTSTIWGA